MLGQLWWLLYVTHASPLQCSCTFVLAEAYDSLEPNHQSSTANLRPAPKGCCCLVLPSLWDRIVDPKLCNHLTHHRVKKYQPFQYLPIHNDLLLPLLIFLFLSFAFMLLYLRGVMTFKSTAVETFVICHKLLNKDLPYKLYSCASCVKGQHIRPTYELRILAFMYVFVFICISTYNYCTFKLVKIQFEL